MEKEQEKIDYSTAQMLERLGFNDTATNQEGKKVGFGEEKHLIIWPSDQEKAMGQEGKPFEIRHPEYRTDRWTIEYDFLTFTEALAIHLQEKKPIIFYYSENRQYEFAYEEFGNFQQIHNDGYGMTELAKGKWLIKHW